MISPRPGRMRIGVITANLSGISLAAALRGCQHIITGIATIGDGITDGPGVSDLEDRCDAMLPGIPLVSPRQVIEESHVVFLCAPHAGQLTEFLRQADSWNAWRAGQLVVHTAADAGANLCQGAAEKGALTLAMHPAMNFTGTSLDVDYLQGAWWALDASALVLPIGQALVSELGGEYQVVEEESRPAYAQAISAATDNAYVLGRQIRGLLRQAGIDEDSYAQNLVVDSIVQGLRGNA